MGRDQADDRGIVTDAVSGVLRFGTLAVGFTAPRSFWTDVMYRRFRATVYDEAGVAPEVRLHVQECSGPGPYVEQRGDPMKIERAGLRVQVLSQAMTLDVDWSAQPAAANLTAYPDGLSEPEIEHYAAIFVNKLLQLCGVARLHGAAVEMAGRTSVFLAEKGSGKSTLALAFGLAGARVLADDQLAIRRRPGGIMVSGCDGNIRLTEKSERHFLIEPIDVAPLDFAGVLKKEVGLGRLVTAIPFEERAARRLYFPSVGTRFDIRPISARVALGRILDSVAAAHRFASPADQMDLVGLLAAFVEPLFCADLELSPDLSVMPRVVQEIAH